MVCDSTYHGFCSVFKKEKEKSEISQLLLFILLIIIYIDRCFFNSYIQGRNHTLHCREPAPCRFTRASYFYRKHQNTAHSKHSKAVTMLSLYQMREGWRSRGKGMEGQEFQQRTNHSVCGTSCSGSTHSPPVLEYSLFFRTDFAIISGTGFCGGKNHKEPLVYCCQLFSCTKKNILICTFSLAW